MIDAGGKVQIEPQVPGYYLWYIMDLGYFECGVVHVSADSPEHLEYLRGPTSRKEAFHIYLNEKAETLTMYFEASGGQKPHLPPKRVGGRPNVDLYVSFDFSALPIRRFNRDKIYEAEVRLNQLGYYLRDDTEFRQGVEEFAGYEEAYSLYTLPFERVHVFACTREEAIRAATQLVETLPCPRPT